MSSRPFRRSFGSAQQPRPDSGRFIHEYGLTTLPSPDVPEPNMRRYSSRTITPPSHPSPPDSPPRSSRHTRSRTSSREFTMTPATEGPHFLRPSNSATVSSVKKSISSPTLHLPQVPHSYQQERTRSGVFPAYMHQAGEGMELDSEDDQLLYANAPWQPPSIKTTTNLRTRVYGGAGSGLKSRERLKSISTTPGLRGAGETETETDEPIRQLPTSRIVHSSNTLIPPNTLAPILFEFSRLLSIVPAVYGTLFNLYYAYSPPTPVCGTKSPETIDYLVSALWAILTGWQCLCFTTGLLTRWRLYYPPLPTLIRLLALQAICWPATHLTLTLFQYEKRPVMVWAVVGTSTCCSRSVQIWVTSNLWWEGSGRVGDSGTGKGGEEKDRGGYWKRWSGGKWGGRRWDWGEVGVRCVLPAGVVYFMMAWAEAFRREWEVVGDRPGCVVS